MDQKMVEHYHNRGYMPDRFYYQQNEKSIEENYIEQKRKNNVIVLERERIQELKKELENQTFQATMLAIEQGIDPLHQQMLHEIGNMLNSAFSGGSVRPEKLHNISLSTQLGVVLGKALADAPFRLLDEILNDKEN